MDGGNLNSQATALRVVDCGVASFKLSPNCTLYFALPSKSICRAAPVLSVAMMRGVKLVCRRMTQE